MFKGLKKGSYTLDYNKKKFQKMDNNINTCGRWCIVFLSKYIQHLDKKVVKFSDLENYKDIYQLLPEWEDYRIILIEQKPRMGHWVCLTRRNDIFIFFDSYGYNPFQNLNFISKKMNELLGQEKTDFSGLFKGLKKGSYKLDYNKKKFQKMDNNINTCGRWCIVFLSKFIQGYSLKEFQLWMEKEKKNWI